MESARKTMFHRTTGKIPKTKECVGRPRAVAQHAKVISDKKRYVSELRLCFTERRCHEGSGESRSPTLARRIDDTTARS